MGELAHSREYLSFRSSVPLQKVCVDGWRQKEWAIYDVGSKNVKCPLVCLPPVSGRAEVFFKQLLALSATGYRVIAVEYPVLWTCNEFCEEFVKLLDHLRVDRVHLFGASLGGFLAQKFAEYSARVHRVQSIIICNSFTDTEIFEQTYAAPTYWLLPSLVLKRMVMGNFERGSHDAEMSDAIDFVVDNLDSLNQRELASRLTLNCRSSSVATHLVSLLPITVIDVNDDSALSPSAKGAMYRIYPDARRAHLKSGGNFPYLSRSSEVNLYLQIHLRQFDSTKYSAKDVGHSEPSTGQPTAETCLNEAPAASAATSSVLC